MPGLTLLISDEARSDPSCEPSKGQSILVHGPRYQPKSVISQLGLHLGWVAYEEYPVRVFRSHACVIYFEGRIYNRPIDLVEAELAAIASEIFEPARDDRRVARFMLDNHGSYIVAIVRPHSRDIVIFSDYFCRLPLYYAANEVQVIIAREAKFVHAMRPGSTFDRVGCAQVLAFGLPLGDRTVLEGVKSFPAAGLLRAQAVNGHVTWSLRELHSWNFDEEDVSKPLSAHADEFADLFSSACRNWGSHPDSGGNLVSLSGGHDSRAVAAGLAATGTQVMALTYRDPNGKREFEIDYARQLAKILKIEWHCIDLPLAPASAYEELAWLKDGMNYTYMGFILKYLEEIVRRWGPQHKTFMSGDGGDDCLKVTSPKLSFRDINDVIRYIIKYEICMPLDRAEAILKLPAGTLHDELEKVFESYPEKVLARRIKRFKVLERARRFYFEGEDRTRAFLWQDSPFYSLPLFLHSMRVPDRLKYDHVFCRKAMMAVSPAAAAVPVHPSGYPPASWKYAVYHRTKGFLLALPEPVVAFGRRIANMPIDVPYNIPNTFTNYLREQLSHDTPLAALLDGSQVPRGLQQINEQSFYCFWTVAMLEKAYRLRIG
jgi:asparagine synthase (glutamine-hydrolysing)